MNNIHIDTIFMTERRLLCARHIGPYQGIGAAFEELERELSRLGLRAEAMLAVYHDNPATVSQDSLRSDAAAQIADNDLITDTMLKPFTIGAGSFARWTHKGPYKDLHNTWQAGYKAMADLGLQANGVCYEAYVNDPCNTEPHLLITEIYQQLA